MRERNRELEHCVADGLHYTDVENYFTSRYNVSAVATSAVLTDGAETMLDEVTTGYEKISRDGGIVSNPMSHTKWYDFNQPLSGGLHVTNYPTAEGPNHWTSAWYWGYPFRSDSGDELDPTDAPVPFLTDEWLANQQNLAKTSVLAKLSETPSQTFVTAGEADETLAFLKDTLLSAYQICRDIRKMRRRTRSFGRLKKSRSYREHIRLAKQAWLQWRYALRPMIGEVQGFMKALEDFASYRPKRTSFRSYEGRQESASHDYPDFCIRDTRWFMKRSLTVTKLVAIRAGVLVEYRGNTGNIQCADAFGIRQEDVLPAAWDLVPYSFLIDFFLNTAQFVASWSPKVDTKILSRWCTTTITTISEQKLSDYYYVPSAGVSVIAVSGTLTGGTRRRVHVSKVREIDWITPVLPALDIRLNVAKLADIVALLGNFKDLRYNM